MLELLNCTFDMIGRERDLHNYRDCGRGLTLSKMINYPLKSFNKGFLLVLHGLNSEFCFVPEVSGGQGELQAEVYGRSHAAFILFMSDPRRSAVKIFTLNCL